jgi:hypothetical protein
MVPFLMIKARKRIKQGRERGMTVCDCEIREAFLRGDI